MEPSKVSAFILSPRVDAVLAAEQSTCAHVGKQCGKCYKGQNDVQQVNHVFLGVECAMLCRAPGRIT
jgi:hypothetical protein